MNTIQLKVLVKSMNVSHVGQDSKLMITGECKFHHYDSTSPNKKKTCTLQYKAFGYAAQTLQKIKVNTTCIISGSLDIYPPNKENPNHQVILSMNTVIPVEILDTAEYNKVVSKPKSTTVKATEQSEELIPS
ncbi:MAG: hypothetical protein AB4063_21475 [Crocosphaera sp.]